MIKVSFLKILKKILKRMHNQKKITTKGFYFYDKQVNSIWSHTSTDFELNWDVIVPNSKADLWYELVKKPRYLKKIHKLQLME